MLAKVRLIILVVTGDNFNYDWHDSNKIVVLWSDYLQIDITVLISLISFSFCFLFLLLLQGTCFQNEVAV